MLQNARVTAVTVSELLRDNQKGRVGKITPFHPYYNSYRPLTTFAQKLHHRSQGPEYVDGVFFL